MSVLYHQNKNSYHANNDGHQASGAMDDEEACLDGFQHHLGTKVPSNVSNSNGWSRREQNKLMVMTDDAEIGNFGTMTTLTHHNWCPEMLAAVRRGPLAKPTEDELIEHLILIRHKGGQLIISSAASKRCNGFYQQIALHNEAKQLWVHGIASNMSLYSSSFSLTYLSNTLQRKEESSSLNRSVARGLAT